MNKNPKDTGSIYLPERYKQQIEAKKRRRLIKKIVVICTVVALCSVLFLIVSGALSNSLNQPPLVIPGSMISVPEITPTSPPGEPTTTSGTEHDSCENHRHHRLIRESPLNQPTICSPWTMQLLLFVRIIRNPIYTLISVNVTDLFADRTLYEFKIKQINTSQDEFRVFGVYRCQNGRFLYSGTGKRQNHF